ncbi:hypothetical protein OXB_3382 [Bacillus sp. OxB-1]|uniref:FusB/FusC family EF-G-binding protein n=1 Tax=Bacillus sp. (strain OxB-1) TaxID=98228 RepID=UPI000581F8F6|nr:elongation factor G-binding protein [Bacillus sp. OxB-1]BAQ11851.1 hypothetical protein OXB_3382 [Bacillus sp. OxB-1]
MEPFIQSAQFNFIKFQIKNLVYGHASAKDAGVIRALESLTVEKVIGLFGELTDEQRQVLEPISEIREPLEADQYLIQLKRYVLPFPSVEEKEIRKLFSKVKKLTIPVLDKLDLQEISYLGWNDTGSNKKYIVVPQDEKLIGIQGTFQRSTKKGICAICNGHEEVGMFTAGTRRSGQDTYTKRGNYICVDSMACNENLTDLTKLHDFIQLLQK